MSAQENGSVDLAALDTRAGAEAGFWLRLLDPRTGKKTPGRLKLLGADAEACYLKARAYRRVRALLLVGQGSDELEFEKLLELLEAATVGWESLSLNGEPYAYSAERVRPTYLRWRWMVDLAWRAIDDRANFLPGSARD
jgi:hypothetical protein